MWFARRVHRLTNLMLATVLLLLVAGCLREKPDIHYLSKEKHSYYRNHASEIDFADVNQPLSEDVSGTAPPHTIHETNDIPIRDISLAETIHLTLTNSQIIRTAGAFMNPGNPLLSNPNNVPSVFDPAIQQSGVLFGNRGVEAALSAFDAQLNASMLWGRNELIQNNLFAGGGVAGAGSVLVTETGAFQSNLQKTFANGGTASIFHNVNYLGNNVDGTVQMFPSVYTGNIGVGYQMPLLAGAGTEFTRIAGPIGQQFGGLTGVSQGVLIARINEDISLADFEESVHNLVRDCEDAYWDLYLAYRNYHTAVTAKESSLLTWRIADLQLQGGVRTRAEVAQARDQYFATEAASSNARSRIYTAETRLRRLTGLPVNDGTTLRPIDEPVSAELIPDWYVSLTEALTQRVELRRQKWNMKSLELQKRAAESLVRPRLDFVSSYQVNGFGDQLLGYNDDRYGNFYQDLATNDQTGWNLGLQMNWNLGFRSQLAQVRNYELRIAKAQKVLQEQEKEISHELAVSFQELSRSYAAAEINMNRMIAARENVKYLEPNIREGAVLLDELLRAQLRQAEAEVAYYESLVDYNKSLNNLQYRKGTLLQHNSVFLAESAWTQDAYYDADRNSQARNHAHETELLDSYPEPFALDSPAGGVFFTAPESGPEMIPTTAPPAEIAPPTLAPAAIKEEEE